MAHLEGCKSLTALGLSGTQVTDAGLAHFKDCKGLTVLDLRSTKVGDAGLAHLEDCKGMMRLYLSPTQVGNAGLAHFVGCKNLKTMWGPPASARLVLLLQHRRLLARGRAPRQTQRGGAGVIPRARAVIALRVGEAADEGMELGLGLLALHRAIFAE